MKIEVDVLGVEQSMNFDTMKTDAFVVLEVFGEVVRVPITEGQMEQLTVAAVNHAKLTSGQTFENTRTRSATPPSEERFDEQEEREFSVMSELAEHTEEQEPMPGGMEGIFGNADEQAKVEQLRRRPPLSLPTLAMHTPTAEESALPRLAGFGGGPVADDDFAQG